jgi:hypothetical protein
MTSPPPRNRRKQLFFVLFISAFLALGFAAARALPAAAEATALSIQLPNVSLPPAAQTYYVAPTGSDSNAGTQAAPWKTIQRGLNALGPDKMVVVRGGTYSEMAVANAGGSSASRATLIAYPGERPVLAGRLKITAPYLRVSGFVFEPGSNSDTLVWIANTDVELSSNELRNGTMSCVFGGGDRVRILSNWIHDCGTHLVNGVPQDHGVYYTGGNNGLIANNVIERAIGFGIQVHPYSASNTGNVIRDNTITGNGRLVAGSQGASGIILDGSATSNTLVENNVLAWNSETGVRSLGTIGSGNVIRGNLGWENPKGNFPTGFYGGGLTYDANSVAEPFTSSTSRYGSVLIGGSVTTTTGATTTVGTTTAPATTSTAVTTTAPTTSTTVTTAPPPPPTTTTTATTTTTTTTTATTSPPPSEKTNRGRSKSPKNTSIMS